MSTRTRGALASAALLLLATACGSSEPEIDSSSVAGADRAACERLVAALPDTLAGEDRRGVSPSDALGAAWGDPAIVLVCGVPVPEGFNDFSTCVEANGVGWFVPPEQVEDKARDVTFTAVGYRPAVQLRLPATYRPEGGAAALAELAEPVRKALELEKPCL